MLLRYMLKLIFVLVTLAVTAYSLRLIDAIIGLIGESVNRLRNIVLFVFSLLLITLKLLFS
jgi:hypothetical protein